MSGTEVKTGRLHFKDLLRQLEEEYNFADSARKTLLAENSKLQEENARLVVGEPSDGGGPLTPSGEQGALAFIGTNSVPASVNSSTFVEGSKSGSKGTWWKSAAGVTSIGSSAAKEATKTPGPMPSFASKAAVEEMLERVDNSRMVGAKRDTCIVSPVSRFKLGWDAFAFGCLMVDLWATPLELVFMEPAVVPRIFTVLNAAISVFFVIDMALNFNTGFIDRDRLVMCRAASIKRYVASWFWIDLLATIPFDWFAGLMLGSGDVLSVTRLVRLTKITKVLKTLRFLRVLRAIILVKRMHRTSSVLGVYQIAKHFMKVIQLIVGLGFMAHIHGCLFALLQTDIPSHDFLSALRYYYYCFWWAYNALSVGNSHLGIDDSPGVWTLEMAIASERIVIILVIGGFGIVRALTLFQEDAQLALVKNAAVGFFRQHSISIETQISVMYSLHETKAAQKMQRHFKSLVSEHLPDELRRTVSEELWVPHLTTLGLIAHMSMWNEDFVPELALLVREEVVASKTVLCKEGHPSIAAYYILKGRLMVASSALEIQLPDFTDGMWVEETALMSPVRRRQCTIVTPMLTTLMSVPSQAFHELITTLGLDVTFQHFRETRLMSGLCGRCGQIGDHFTHACPKAGLNLHKGRIRHLRSRRRKRLLSAGSNGTGKKLLWGDNHDVSQTLDSFLHAHRLQALAPILSEHQIQTQADLMTLDYEALREEVQDQETLQKPLALLQRLVAEQQEMFAMEESAELTSAQHLAFLSHYKMESGTEAALMRAELERALQEDKESLAHKFDAPVFLDSEDLFDLEQLEEHVRKSHNLMLLLTENVLLRPWVLVEVVAAVEAGIRVVPVEVQRKGAGFVFPDERFYAKLVSRKVLDEDGEALLAERGIDLSDVEKALRETFNKIAVPYSPHRAEGIRMAEVRGIYKQLRIGANPQTRTPMEFGNRMSSTASIHNF